MLDPTDPMNADNDFKALSELCDRAGTQDERDALASLKSYLFELERIAAAYQQPARTWTN